MDLALHDRTAAAAGRLDGRTAIVTGSTSGIGLGIAQALAGAGASVVLNGFGKPDAMRGTLAELTGLGGRGGLFRRRHVEAARRSPT